MEATMKKLWLTYDEESQEMYLWTEKPHWDDTRGQWAGKGFVYYVRDGFHMKDYMGLRAGLHRVSIHND